MKKFVSMSILLLAAGGASAATLVQSKVCTYAPNGGGSTTAACSLNSAATVNNHIIAVVTNTSLRTVVSGADSGSTSYTQAGSAGASQPSIWYGPATSTSAGNSVVFTLSGNTGDDMQVVLFEVSGLASNQTGLTQALNTTASGTTHTSNSITPANANGFAVAVSRRGNRSYTEDTDWTQLSTGAAGSYAGYIANPPASSLNISFISDTSAIADINLAAFVGAATGNALYYGYTPTMYAAPSDQGLGDCSSEGNACDLTQAIAAADCGDVLGLLPGVYSGDVTGGNHSAPIFEIANMSCSEISPLVVTAKYPALYNHGSPALLSEFRSNDPDLSDYNNNSPVIGAHGNSDWVFLIGGYADWTYAPPLKSHGVTKFVTCDDCTIEGWVFDQIATPTDDNYISIWGEANARTTIKNNLFRGGEGAVSGSHNASSVTIYGLQDFTIANNTCLDVNTCIFVKGSNSGLGNWGVVEKNKVIGASSTAIDIAVVRVLPGETESYKRVIVRENLVVATGSNIVGAGLFFCDSSGDGCNYADFYNNTGIGAAPTDPVEGLNIFGMLSAYQVDITFRDNVAYFPMAVGSTARPIHIDNVSAATAYSILDYNFYGELGGAPTYAYGGTPYTGISAYRSALGGTLENNSTENSSPTFVNSGAGDWRLSGDTGSSTSGSRGITTAPADLGAPGT